MELIDESAASEYIGKVILIGITRLDQNEDLISQDQWVGTILTFSRKEGIRIRLRNSQEEYTLPPSKVSIRRASPGVYKLRSTGESIEDPSYLATWTVVAFRSED